MKNKYIIITVLALVIVGGAAFYGGMKYQQSKASNFRQFAGNRNDQGGPPPQGQGARNGFRPVAGEIIASDDKSITVKLQDGSSKVVILTDSTSINKASEASKSDLATGQQVAVYGTENSDGSVTAQNIQLNPMFREFSGSPQPTPGQ